MTTTSPTTVPCPYCDAPAGKPCVTASGNLARTPHSGRAKRMEEKQVATTDSDTSRITLVFEEIERVIPEIDALLGVYEDSSEINVLTDEERDRLDELMSRHRALVNEMRILSLGITAAHRTEEKAPAPAPESHPTPTQKTSSGPAFGAAHRVCAREQEKPMGNNEKAPGADTPGASQTADAAMASYRAWLNQNQPLTRGPAGDEPSTPTSPPSGTRKVLGRVGQAIRRVGRFLRPRQPR